MSAGVSSLYDQCQKGYGKQSEAETFKGNFQKLKDKSVGSFIQKGSSDVSLKSLTPTGATN